MSTESIGRENIDLYLWQDSLDSEDYIEATYYLESLVDLELATIAMAKEQSATVAEISNIVQKSDLIHYTARVTSIEPQGTTNNSMLPDYRLSTHVYPEDVYCKNSYNCAKVKIAFPVANFGLSLTNLWNAVGGELHRLGFLNALRIIDLRFPKLFLNQFAGPTHGAAGIRSQLNIVNRPIFCRSARPAVGLTTEMMLKINESVLRGGFDIVKDDELTCDTPLSPFIDRIERMVNLVRQIQEETGERKYYIANIMGDFSKSMKLADAAASAGVNAVLVSPTIQGFSIAGEIAKKTGLAVLSHSSWEDVLTRHPRFGVSPDLYIKIQRICGADMMIMPGNFATDSMSEEDSEKCVTACTDSLGNIEPLLPIIAGGKTPEGLAQYLNLFGNAAFMIIAATAVDNHHNGIEAGARAFREAWSNLESAR